MSNRAQVSLRYDEGEEHVLGYVDGDTPGEQMTAIADLLRQAADAFALFAKLADTATATVLARLAQKEAGGDG